MLLQLIFIVALFLCSHTLSRCISIHLNVFNAYQWGEVGFSPATEISAIHYIVYILVVLF